MWPRMRPMPAIQGRAAAFGPVSSGGPAACQFYRCPALDSLRTSDAYPPASSPPFRVEPLPAKISVTQTRALAGPQPIHGPSVPAESSPAQSDQGPPDNGRQTAGPAILGKQVEVLLGVAGDEPAAASFRIPCSGIAAVLGNPGSGKSNALRALVALNPGQPWRRHHGPPQAAGDFWAAMLRQAESGTLPRETTLLVDDVDQLAPAVLRDLGQLNALGHAMVIAAAYSPLLLQRVPLIMNARASGVGLLLGPRSMADGDLFGIRFDIESHPPPGRGSLISGGRSFPVQVAWAGGDK